MSATHRPPPPQRSSPRAAAPATPLVRDLVPIDELEQGLLIDQNALDAALLEQPEMFNRVSKALNYLVSQRDAAKQYVGDIEARVELRIRKARMPTDAEGKVEKIREGEVAAHVRLDADVLKANADYLDLAAQAAQYAALKEAFQQRSYVLKDLVGLYIAGYFGNTTPAGSADALKDRQADRARRGMAESRAARGRERE